MLVCPGCVCPSRWFRSKCQTNAKGYLWAVCICYPISSVSGLFAAAIFEFIFPARFLPLRRCNLRLGPSG